MLLNNSDVSWRRWGAENPYYGVLTDERFRDATITADLKKQFFETGQVHVDRVLAVAEKYLGPVAHTSALDFGCGTGRLVVALSKTFERVLGVDISQGMLDAAAESCGERGQKNASFAVSDDQLTQIAGKFDFVHCYLVMQHIPVVRGLRIIGNLIDRVGDNGVLALHFPFERNDSRLRQAVASARKHFSPLHVAVNLLKRRRWNEPLMQMNSYKVNKILLSLTERGFQNLFVEVVDTGGFVSAFVFARRSCSAVKSQGAHIWALT